MMPKLGCTNVQPSGESDWTFDLDGESYTMKLVCGWMFWQTKYPDKRFRADNMIDIVRDIRAMQLKMRAKIERLEQGKTVCAIS